MAMAATAVDEKITTSRYRDNVQLMSIAPASHETAVEGSVQAWTHARAELVRLGVPTEAWPHRWARVHATPKLMYTYWLRNPLDWLPRIVVLLTEQRYEITSEDLGTEHSVCFPFGDDALAAWEACKRQAGWPVREARKRQRRGDRRTLGGSIVD